VENCAATAGSRLACHAVWGGSVVVKPIPARIAPIAVGMAALQRDHVLSVPMEEDVGADVIHRLERLGIDYVITGSEALARFGEPRQTADIDIVLQLQPEEFGPIRRAFEGDYVVNAPVQAQGRVLASVVATSGLGKADFMLGRNDAWSRSAMRRRERWDHPSLGATWVLSLEDLILAKLEWSAGVSELQLRDCANLLRTNAADVDWTYLERYARNLGLTDLLHRVRAASA
jgi:hypothetical protein